MSSKKRSKRRKPASRSTSHRSPPPRQRPDEDRAVDLDFAGVPRRTVGYAIDLALLLTLGLGINRVGTDWLSNGHAVLIALLLIHPCIVISYGALFIAWRGATVGMKAVKLIAVNSSDGCFLERRRAWARSTTAFALTGLAVDVASLWGFKSSSSGIDGAIAAAASLLTLAGYATYFYWAKYDPLHQTIQDKAGHSVVLYGGIREKTRPPRRRPGWTWRAATSGLSCGYASGYTTPVGRKGSR